MSKKKKTLDELLEEALVPEDEQPHEIPENWIWVDLNTLAESIQYGYTESATFEEIGPKFLRITDIQDSGVDWESVPYCIIKENEFKKYKLEKDDILVARTGATTGKSFKIEEVGNAVFASYLIRIRLNKLADASFIDNYMKSSAYWNQIMLSKKGIAQPGANSKILGALKIPLPSIKEQKRIANKISILFAKLDKSIQLIEGTKKAFEVRRATILDKVLKSLEEESNIMTLSELVEFQNGLSKRSGKIGEEVVVLRLADIKSGNIDLSDSRKIILTDNEREKYGLNKNDILFIRVNGSRKLVGTAIVVESVDEMAFCDHLIRGTLNRSKVTESFVKYIFESNYVRSQIEDRIVSSAGQNTISQKSLSEIKIPVPSIEKMQWATEYLDKVFEKEKLSFQQIESINLKAIKQAILSKAFKGKLDTNDPTDEPAIELLKSILQEKL